MVSNGQSDGTKWSGLTRFVLFLTIVLAVGSFVLSFSGLYDFSLTCGYHPWLAWIWPLTIDGVIVAATIAVVAFSRRQDTRLWYVWMVLILASIGSIAGNIATVIFGLHTYQVSNIYVLAVGKAIPPIGLILMTHMSVMLADPHPKTPKIEALGAEVTAAIPPIETGMPVVEEVDVLGMAPQETATTPVQVEPTPPEKPSTAAPVQEEPVEVPVEIEESPVVTDEEVSLVEELPESVPTLSTDGGKHETPGEGEEIPKRILKTLQFLTECREKQAEATPEGLAEAIGVSRDTARRYLREAQTFESEEDEHENHEDQEN